MARFSHKFNYLVLDALPEHFAILIKKFNYLILYAFFESTTHFKAFRPGFLINKFNYLILYALPENFAFLMKFVKIIKQTVMWSPQLFKIKINI